ncbi:amidohydrolase [Niabella ginsenosidivorans]|uniref:Amidohydrolase n=1 Tax=Niabella ginsenosidivorans TaxID=1176587 RepID=A0A1A9I8Q4_9BACT|nr:amidohydrolase [Niabella ginsenosidivorans]
MLLASCNFRKEKTQTSSILLQDVLLIDGNGGAPLMHMDVRIRADSIAEIGRKLDTQHTLVIPMSGKTVMPALTSAHVHVGSLKGTANKPENYTRNNILSQLKKYADYGITNILVMGTDLPMLFQSGLRDSSVNNLLPGARLFSAGYGFGPPGFNTGHLYQPQRADQVPAQMDSLAQLRPAVVKIWVDDFAGHSRKMDTAVYRAVIREAHKHGLRVAAHVYYLADARRLVADGVDMLAHSIRDSVIDDNLVKQMKEKKVIYIPTLALDLFSFAYAGMPEWINDPFFKAALEPGVYEMITAPGYSAAAKNSPLYARNRHGFETALKNLKKLQDAGVLIAMGTDSGAQPIRVQGFSEHMELALMVQAGLTPLQAITAATKNAAHALKINAQFGTITPGKKADLLIINGNPATAISNTRNIAAVYKAGRQVSKGPKAP